MPDQLTPSARPPTTATTHCRTCWAPLEPEFAFCPRCGLCLATGAKHQPFGISRSVIVALGIIAFCVVIWSATCAYETYTYAESLKTSMAGFRSMMPESGTQQDAQAQEQFQRNMRPLQNDQQR